MKYKIKDSGKRQKYKSGMHRDTNEDKPRYDLLLPIGQKTENTLLYRWAMHMLGGIKKYGNRNWELANTQEEAERFKQSAFRHFIQWINEENDEDHIGAILFNINAHEWIKEKMLSGG